ncbi:hypothetical protein GCM10027059_37750 [Myceligenerans halotolerans]
MTSPTIFLDVGDVLIRTHAGAQYAAMADLTGVTTERISRAAEPLVSRLETGVLAFDAFVEEIAMRLGIPRLPRHEIESAWCAVIGEVDATVAAPAGVLARAGRVVLASNTSAVHWKLVKARLVASGIDAPMFSSFQAGARKPSETYFAALVQQWRPTPGSVFIDDRAENVHAAERHGLVGHRHTDAAETADLLTALASVH